MPCDVGDDKEQDPAKLLSVGSRHPTQVIAFLGLFEYGLAAEGEPASGGLGNVRHVISIHDVVSDTMHQFAPSYHDYVLYSNGGTKEAPKKVRTSFMQGFMMHFL